MGDKQVLNKLSVWNQDAQTLRPLLHMLHDVLVTGNWKYCECRLFDKLAPRVEVTCSLFSYSNKLFGVASVQGHAVQGTV